MLGLKLSIPFFIKNKKSFLDSFDRQDASTLGAQWQLLQGTFGIASNKAYCTTSNNGDIAIVLATMDYKVACKMSGSLVNSASQHLPNLVFRALDNNNYLFARISSNNLELYKKQAGSITKVATVPYSIADGVEYNLSAECIGKNINISVDGKTPSIIYSLPESDVVFSGYKNVGIRLSAGPGTIKAKWDQFIWEEI